MKKNNMLLLLGMILMLGLFSISSYANNSSLSVMRNWGMVLNNGSQLKDVRKYAEGKNAMVLEEDVQKATEFYQLLGMDEKVAREKAEEYMLEYEAMYQKAIEAGFQVTDEEVWDYVDELKEYVKSASNKEEVMAVIEQFESEEAYWEYEFAVYKKSLPIQQYVENLEKEYKSEASNSKKTTDEIEQAWEMEFTNLKRKAVLEEEYVLKK